MNKAERLGADPEICNSPEIPLRERMRYQLIGVLPDSLQVEVEETLDAQLSGARLSNKLDVPELPVRQSLTSEVRLNTAQGVEFVREAVVSLEILLKNCSSTELEAQETEIDALLQKLGATLDEDSVFAVLDHTGALNDILIRVSQLQIHLLRQLTDSRFQAPVYAHLEAAFNDLTRQIDIKIRVMMRGLIAPESVDDAEDWAGISAQLLDPEYFIQAYLQLYNTYFFDEISVNTAREIVRTVFPDILRGISRVIGSKKNLTKLRPYLRELDAFFQVINQNPDLVPPQQSAQLRSAAVIFWKKVLDESEKFRTYYPLHEATGELLRLFLSMSEHMPDLLELPFISQILDRLFEAKIKPFKKRGMEFAPIFLEVAKMIGDTALERKLLEYQAQSSAPSL